VISAELTEFIEAGLSMLVGTRDARLVPDYVRAVGARVEKGGREVTVFLPAATSAASIANLADNGRIAMCVSRPVDHRTVQLKGRVVSSGSAADADRPLLERYRTDFAATLAYVGVPPRLTLRMSHWPSYAVRFRVESLFDQTPGPGAGAEIRRGAAPRKGAH
jgi:pyridoxamine 5'-phosphate oxidase-like protein